MTPFVLAAVGLLVVLVVAVVSKAFRYIMLSASVALVVCLVAFPNARLCASQATTSIAGKFMSTFNPGAGAVSDSGESALAEEVDADNGDADEELADDDNGSDGDSGEGSSLIVEAYGAGASGALVNLLAAQGRDPVAKLVGMIKLAVSAHLPKAAAADGEMTEPELDVY
jgi:hypothetical protein